MVPTIVIWDVFCIPAPYVPGGGCKTRFESRSITKQFNPRFIDAWFPQVEFESEQNPRNVKDKLVQAQDFGPSSTHSKS